MEYSDSTVTLLSQGVESTHEIGRIIGRHLKKGDVILLNGDLGSGKTCITQGLIQGIGSEDIARSPTFVIIAEYAAVMPIYHIDLYRLEEFEQVDDLQLDEYLYGDGICIVEWANRASHAFPDNTLSIRFESLDDTTRVLELTIPSMFSEREVGMMNSLNSKLKVCG